jgi:hypothetical protein
MNGKPDLPPVAPIKPGRYRHHKGNDYEVIGVARHSETLEELVIYCQLHRDRSLWARPRALFEGDVTIDGHRRPRFEFVAPFAEA